MANGRLAQLLGGQMGLRPSPNRSAMVQQLLQQSAAQPQGSGSIAETLNIASRPVMAALLARREEAARRQQAQQSQQALAQAMGLPQPAQTGLMDPRTGEVESRQTERLLNPQQQSMQDLISALSGGQAQALIGQVLQQQVAPEQEPAVTEIGKINQDVQQGNITRQTGQSLREAALNQDKRSIGKAETDLRKEFNSHVSGFQSGLMSLENARNLLSLKDNPVAAQSALTAFVRAIDNSVVRPSEQQMYQNIFGVAQGLENRIGQLLGRGAFTEQSKQEILEAVNSLSRSAEDYMERNAEFYNRLARDSGLRPENVTGGFTPREREESSEPTQSRSKPSTDDEPVLEIL